MYLKVAKRVDLKHSHHKKKWQLYEEIQVLAITIMDTILQQISISLMQGCKSITSQYSQKKTKLAPKPHQAHFRFRPFPQHYPTPCTAHQTIHLVTSSSSETPNCWLAVILEGKVKWAQSLTHKQDEQLLKQL